MIVTSSELWAAWKLRKDFRTWLKPCAFFRRAEAGPFFWWSGAGEKKSGSVRWFRDSDSRSACNFSECEGMFAMASGLPVVATPVGGVPEVVKNGKNGLLVPTKDPVALAEALRKIRQDPLLAEELGREGRETVRERYSHRRVAEEVMEIYRESLRETPMWDSG
jgi:hypothetical protein